MFSGNHACCYHAINVFIIILFLFNWILQEFDFQNKKFLLAFLHIYAVLMPHFAAVAFCIKYNLVYEKVRNGNKKG